MQIYVMQCINSNGIKKYIWLINENGYEIKDETYGQKEKREFMQFNLI